MRHRWGRRKLGRPTSHRHAMLRNMVTSLLEHEQIETTDAKAKEVRRVAERMITLGKRGDLHARRMAMRVVRTREVATKLFDELAPRYQARAGGYTRVLKVRRRVGDAAPMSIVELVDRGVAAAPAKPAKAPEKRAAKPKPEKKAEKPAREKKPAAKAPKASKGGASKAGGAKKTGRAPRAPK